MVGKLVKIVKIIPQVYDDREIENRQAERSIFCPLIGKMGKIILKDESPEHPYLVKVPGFSPSRHSHWELVFITSNPDSREPVLDSQV